MDSWWKQIRHFTLTLCAIFFLCSPNTSLQAQNAEPYKDGPVHEAYLTPSTEGGAILQSIANTPPSPINEQQPPKCHAEAIWISGYWSWEHNKNDFVWVSGVWRRPPSGHVWISGYWKKFDVGWAWVRGFWSKDSEYNLKYIDKAPPDPKEEKISASPGDDHFWMPGYWAYDHASRSYNWLGGQWVKLDPSWVYVPAYYLWRPDGYLFVPGYWDLPLDSRGCIYSPVLIPPAARSTIVYTPSIIMQPDWVIRWAFLRYPNFGTFFWWHSHFYPGFWDAWCCVPPWWNWQTCWCFNWHDTWGLWWWWTHPGFQHPLWLLMGMAGHIPPPFWQLLDWMAMVFPPPIIFPFGVVPPGALINAIRGNMPIMPNDPERIREIQDQLKPLFPEQTPLRPGGNEEDLNTPLPRPDIGETEEPDQPMVTPPPLPETNQPPAIRPPETYVPPRPVLPPRPPRFEPPSQRPPTYYPPHRPHRPPPPRFEPPRPRPYPPHRPPHRPHRPPRPEFRPPSHHYLPPMRPTPEFEPPTHYPSRPHDDMDVPQTSTPGGGQTHPPMMHRRPHNRPPMIQRRFQPQGGMRQIQPNTMRIQRRSFQTPPPSSGPPQGGSSSEMY